MTENQPVGAAPADDNPETIEVLAQVFQDWKREHPGGTWRTFWVAVAAGEVAVPTA